MIEIFFVFYLFVSVLVRFASASNDFLIEGNVMVFFDYDLFEFDVSDGIEVFGSVFVYI